MPKIHRTALSPDYVALSAATAAFGEVNDCSVKALALVTGRPYTEVHAALKAAGRRDRAGTPVAISWAVLRSFGFRVREWSVREMFDMMNSYPGADTSYHNRWITTHHWRRFPQQWAPHRHKKLILITRNHMLAVVGGDVKDWSVNRSLRVTHIWEVE